MSKGAAEEAPTSPCQCETCKRDAGLEAEEVRPACRRAEELMAGSRRCEGELGCGATGNEVGRKLGVALCGTVVGVGWCVERAQVLGEKCTVLYAAEEVTGEEP